MTKESARDINAPSKHKEELKRRLHMYHSPHCASRAAWAPHQTEPRPCDCGLWELVQSQLTAYTASVIGPDDPLQLASDAPGHIRYIQQVERNKLRREQRERNKA